MDDPEVEPLVSGALGRGLTIVLLLSGVFLSVGGAAPAQAATLTYPPIHGTFTGPSVVGTSSNTTYYINGSGGPAFLQNGSKVGNLTWAIKLSASDLSGISVSPNSSTFSGSGPAMTHLKTSRVAESVTLGLTITSKYQTTTKTKSLNLTVAIVVPFVLRAQLVAGPKQSVLGFDVTVQLDGRTVGTVSVPTIAAGASYNLSYSYASKGLSAGWHTFTISLANEQGLVTFAGGATSYSVSFYVVGPPPDYLLYVLLGAVAFAGVLFIFVTRVAARRRPAARK